MNNFCIVDQLSNPLVGGVSDADFAPRFRRSLRLPPSAFRLGFTLVELLVVIAIIGILVSLLLPAVQAAREAARRTQCLNNVTQIGLALHNYEFQFECFPPGVSDDKGPIRSEPIGKHVSWLVKILPYLEEQTLSGMFDQSAGAYAPVNARVRAAQIPSIVCPSERIDEERDSQVAAGTNYAGCHHDVEAPIDSDNHGILFLNSQIRFADIFDGSSKTILLGEVLQNKDSLGWVSGTRATLRNTTAFEKSHAQFAPPQQGAPGNGTEEKPNSLFVGGFGSYHPGAANFGFADGSSRWIAETIDPAVFRLLGNRADGEITKPF